MPNSNLDLLKHVAKRMGPLLTEVVFVGGCTTGLFFTGEAAAEVRPTFDVDVIAGDYLLRGLRDFFGTLACARFSGGSKSRSAALPLARR